jgi:sugar/nucleoside kinase (ribokinase family)
MARFDITVAGELNLDLILYGLPSELPTERELLADNLTVTLGASSAIMAHNFSALGGKVGFISKIGDDPLGQIAVERLAAGGVDVEKVVRATGRTTGLSVILQRGAQRTILTYPGTMCEMSFDDLDLDYLQTGRHFHCCSIFLQTRLRPRVAELFRRMKEAGLSTSLDTNDDPEDRFAGVPEILKHVDVFLPNEREACKIAGTENLEDAVRRLAELVPTVAVKLGARGSIGQRGRERAEAPGVKVEPVDAVGAGDSFDAGFVYQYLRGADLQTCLEYGNLAGALSTTQPGGTEAFRNGARKKEFFEEQAQLQRLKPELSRPGV